MSADNSTAQAPRKIMAARLRAANLRATRQRVGLAELIFGSGHRHMTAEQLYSEARAAGLNVSQATVYNTLHSFLEAGFLREIVVDPRRSYFDTNTAPHHHFYYEDENRLEDISPSSLRLEQLPSPPAGTRISDVDVVIRVSRR